MTRSKRKRERELAWMHPADGAGLPFIWEDGVHIVQKVEFIPQGIAYTLRCGVMFTFYAPGEEILEARINLPDPTCPICLSLR